jgi:filamentous hemagglutinin
MHASRAIFASYLRNAGEKAIQLTALASALWHGIQAQEQKDPAEFLRKKTGFDQGDREAFGREYANATAARDFYIAASENPKAILEHIQNRCLAGDAPTEQEIDQFVAEKTNAEAVYGTAVYALLGLAASVAPTLQAHAEETQALPRSEPIRQGLGSTSRAGVAAGVETAEAGAVEEAAANELRVGGSIRYVNPTGATSNCANCAVATDATLAGRPAIALSGGVTNALQLARELGGSWIRTAGPDGISSLMLDAGEGARGIVFGGRGADVGHFFNVINQGGVIRFLDGQTGGPANLRAGYEGFWLLRTR